jgi:hypothetical protein
VGTAPELEVVGVRDPAVRITHDVVILEECSLCAAACSTHERALAAVTIPHRSLHGSWNVTTMRFTD